MTARTNKPSVHRYPSFASIMNSDKTRDTRTTKEASIIHSLFDKTYKIEDKRIRSSSLSSQIKSLFIKNLLPKQTEENLSSHKIFKTPFKSEDHCSQLDSVFAWPTSNELNKKFIKLQKSSFNSPEAKAFTSEKKRKRSKFFSMANFQISLNSPSQNIKWNEFTLPREKPNVPMSFLQINSGFASPNTQKSLNDKSQKSLSSFENASLSSKQQKRKTSICKQRNNVIFRMGVAKKETEIDLMSPLTVNLRQGSLSNEKSVEVFKEYTQKTIEIEKDAKRVAEKFEKLVKEEEQEEAFRLKSMDQNDFIRVSDYSVTEHEIALITEEFNKPPESRNMELLDSIIKRLKFFMRFNKLTRIKLLKSAHYKCYTYGLNLFNEGDEGENMYIIVKGAVNVFKKVKDHRTNKTSELLVSSLYDGDHFGELAMIGKGKQKHINSLEILESIKCLEDIVRQQNEEDQMRRLEQKKDVVRKINELEEARRLSKILSLEDEQFLETHSLEEKEKLLLEIEQEQMNMGITKSKRMASVRIAETSFILSLSGENYRNILFNVIKNDLDYKIRILMHLPFFQKYEPYGLIPIANYLTVLNFRLGELLIKEGDDIDGLYIVCKGRCKIVKIIDPKQSRDAVSAQYSEYLKEFNYSKKIENEEATKIGKKKLKKRLQPPNKLPSNCEIIEYKNIGKGECFGGRSLIGCRPKHLFETRNNFINLDSLTPQSARLSVVADSKEVDVLKFSAAHIILIPDYLKKNFINGLGELREFDDYDIEKDAKQRICWNMYKYNVENQIIARSVLQKQNYKDF